VDEGAAEGVELGGIGALGGGALGFARRLRQGHVGGWRRWLRPLHAVVAAQSRRAPGPEPSADVRGQGPNGSGPHPANVGPGGGREGWESICYGYSRKKRTLT
jgi:hypothetical protein